MFSLRDFCEPGDEYVDFSTGEREVMSQYELDVTLTIPVEADNPVDAVKEFIAGMQDGNRTDYLYHVTVGPKTYTVDAEDWSIRELTERHDSGKL